MNSLLWHQGSKSTFSKHSLNYRELSSSHMLQPYDHQCKILVWLSWDEWTNSARNQTCEMSLGYVNTSWIKSLVIFSSYRYGHTQRPLLTYSIMSTHAGSPVPTINICRVKLPFPTHVYMSAEYMIILVDYELLSVMSGYIPVASTWLCLVVICTDLL